MMVVSKIGSGTSLLHLFCQSGLRIDAEASLNSSVNRFFGLLLSDASYVQQ